MQQVVAPAPADECVAAQFHDRLAHFPGAGRRLHRLAERHGDRQRHAPRPFPEELAVLEAEDAAPDAVQMYRDNGHVDAFQDTLHAPAERQQIARAAQRALGEDADYMALLQRLAGAGEGLVDQLGIAAADGDRMHGAEQPVQHRQVVVGAIHDEAHEARQGGADQQAVDEGDMVADQQGRAFARHVLRTRHSDAVDAVGQQPQQEAHEEIAELDQHVDRGGEGGEPDHQHDLVGRQMHRVAQHPQHARGEHDAEHVEEIVGGDQPAALVGAGAQLQEGVERHDEQAGGEADQRQRDQRQGVGGGRRRQQQGADADADRSQGHQAEFHMVARQAAGGDAAESDAHRHGHVHQADLGVAEAQDLLAQQHVAELQQRAQEPEIADAQHRQPQRPHAVEPADARDHLAPGPFGEGAVACRRGAAGNPQAGQRADDGNDHQHAADPRHVIAPGIAHGAAGCRADDDGNEGAELVQAVGAGDRALRQDLRQNAIMRWRK